MVAMIKRRLMLAVLLGTLFLGGYKISKNPEMVKEVTDNIEQSKNTNAEQDLKTIGYLSKKAVKEITGSDESEFYDSEKQNNEQTKTESVLTDEYDNKMNTMAYYRSKLNDDDKKAYDDVLYGIKSHQKEIDIDNRSAEEADALFNAVINDHPEVFYVNGYVYSATTLKDFPVTVLAMIEPDYTMDNETIKENQILIYASIENELKTIQKSGSDFNKMKEIYDYIVENTDYDESASDNQSICSVFINKRSVCNGYAKAEQYLCNISGIRNIFLTGKANGELHAWNLVKLDGAYYNSDVTWGEYMNDSESFDGVNYEYMAVPDKLINSTHQKDSEYSDMPKCESDANDYYIHERKFVSSVDEKTMNKMFGNKDKIISFRCADAGVLNQTVEYLIGNNEIYNYLPEAKNGNVKYNTSADTNVVTFWR